MASVYRLGGALLLESGSQIFVVGEPKRPIRWEDEGFQVPSHTLTETTSERLPWFELFPAQPGERPSALNGESRLRLSVDGVEACELLERCFTIRRNGSVSERLWMLVTENAESDQSGDLDGRWLTHVPEPIWEVVRDSMLRCV